jgi:hypothetical protein
LSSVALGQSQGGQGGAGQAPGTRGGQQAPAGQQAPGTRGGQQAPNIPPGINNPLFRNPEVSRALNINQNQLQQLNQANQQLQDRFRNDFSRLPDNEAARAMRMQELTRNFNNEFARSAGTILSADQLNRYRQIELQSQGLGAFGDPQVQRSLNLNSPQRDHLQNLQQQYQRQFDDIRQLAQDNPQAAEQRFNRLRSQMATQINGILTPEQQRAWSQMTGDPFMLRPSFNAPIRP